VVCSSQGRGGVVMGELLEIGGEGFGDSSEILLRRA